MYIGSYDMLTLCHVTLFLFYHMLTLCQLYTHASLAYPLAVDDLRKVPGVGPYTASAVGSIAFGIHTAVVDGNVIRVMARLRAIDQDPKKAHVIKAVGSLALQLVDVGRAGCSNQALMELGATVCAPENPGE